MREVSHAGGLLRAVLAVLWYRAVGLHLPIRVVFCDGWRFEANAATGIVPEGGGTENLSCLFVAGCFVLCRIS